VGPLQICCAQIESAVVVVAMTVIEMIVVVLIPRGS
jgi:hypothetical protein